MEGECIPPDRISNLPSSLIHKILTLMPMQDAFRTSILSRNWRYCCVKIPKLEFDDKLLNLSTNTQLSNKCKLLHIVYTVLLLHHGPVLEFSLCVSQLQSCCEIDQIILHLARNITVEKFTLCVSPYYKHKLPSSFFSLQKLTHLKLQSCAIPPLPAIVKFSRLISLCFQDVTISMSTLLRFLCCCPVLTSFTLIDENPFIICGYHDLLFLCMPNVEYLRMNCCAIKPFASGVIPLKLPYVLVHLRVLDLSGISFAKADELRYVLLLVSSSPNIQKIRMEMYYNPAEAVSVSVKNLLDRQDYSHVTLDHLCELEITNFCNKKPGMDFVKLILAKSSRLRKVRVVINNQINVNIELAMQRDLLSYRRASSRAQIIFQRSRPSFHISTGLGLLVV